MPATARRITDTTGATETGLHREHSGGNAKVLDHQAVQVAEAGKSSC